MRLNAAGSTVGGATRTRNCRNLAQPDPGSYTETSLAEDLESLCDPRRSVSGYDLANLAWKYFYAYVFEGAHEESVSREEIVELYRLFSRHNSLNEPGDDIEVMNRLRGLSRGLAAFADIPRLCAALERIILWRPPSEGSVAGATNAGATAVDDYFGLDIMCGSGVLLAGEYVQARRNGFSRIELWGVEPDPASAARAYDLVADLGLGGVAAMEPSDPRAYLMAGKRRVHFVANGLMAGPVRLVDPRRFFAGYKTLFSLPQLRAAEAGFYPEGLICYNRAESVSVVLSRETGFQAPDEYRDAPLGVHALLVDGEVVPSHRVGVEFCRFLAD